MGLQERPGRIIAGRFPHKALGPPELQSGRPGPQGKGPLNWKVQAVAGSAGPSRSTGALVQPGCQEGFPGEVLAM